MLFAKATYEGLHTSYVQRGIGLVLNLAITILTDQSPVDLLLMPSGLSLLGVLKGLFILSLSYYSIFIIYNLELTPENWGILVLLFSCFFVKIY